MKNVLITIAGVLLGLVAFPQTVDAGHGSRGSSVTYCSSYSSCGCPIYKRRVIVSYDRHHHPVYRYYSVPMVHRCRTYNRHYQSHRSHKSYSSRYRNSGPHRSHHRGSRSHISISGRYGSISFCR